MNFRQMTLDEAMSFSQSVSRMATEPIEEELRGSDLKPEDKKRLGAAYYRVEAFMKDGEWHTPEEIAEASQCRRVETAMRMARHMRQYGYDLQPKYVKNGLYLYRALLIFTPEI